MGLIMKYRSGLTNLFSSEIQLYRLLISIVITACNLAKYLIYKILNILYSITVIN